MKSSTRNLFRCFLTVVAAMVLAAGTAGAQTTPAKSKSAPSKSKSAKARTSKGRSSKRSAHSKAAGTQTVAAKSGGKGSKKTRARKGAWKRKGQQKIDENRARQIQEALIREKYMQGEPTGVWDSSTEQALTRYQSDNGWQTKVTPDSRAIIKLGLGPDHSQDSVIIPDRRGAAPVSSIAAPAPR